jgi:putative hydrolase of the HAD superfamily
MIPSSPGQAVSIKVVGFDLGETLLSYEAPLDWSSLYNRALAETACACSYAAGETDVSCAAEILGRYNTRHHPRTEEVASDIIISQILSAWGVDPARWLQPATEAFFRYFQQKVRPYPDTLACLRGLRERGLRIGVLTDVPYGMPRAFVERDLEASGVRPLADVLLTSADVGRRKPDPAGFVALAARLDVSPAEMLYVGNEEKDILGARAAGMRSVLVDRDDDRPVWPYDYRVKSLLDFASLFSGHA